MLFRSTCNSAGGLTPEAVQRQFPNVENVVMTPPGSISLNPDPNSVLNLTRLLAAILPGHANPNLYQREGTNWMNRGAATGSNLRKYVKQPTPVQNLNVLPED